MKKKFSLFFFVVSQMINAREQLIRAHKVFWQVLCKVYDHSLGPKMSRTKFFKKSLSYRWPKILAYLFSYYRKWHTSGDNLQGSNRYSDNYCGSSKINSLGPRRLFKSRIYEKKGLPFQWRQDFGVFFLVVSNLTNVRKQCISVQKVFWNIFSKV